jgi:hypothetical protein
MWCDAGGFRAPRFFVRLMEGGLFGSGGQSTVRVS